MNFLSFIAGPSLRKVDAESLSKGGDLGFGEMNQGAEEGDFGVGAEAEGIAHGLHKVLAAIWVDCMVAGVSGDDQTCGSEAFGVASGDGKKDAVAKGHDRLFHGKFFVMAVGNFSAFLQEVRGEKLIDKGQMDDLVGDAQAIGVEFCEGNFEGIMFGAVVEADGGGDITFEVCVIECDHGIHSPAY